MDVAEPINTPLAAPSNDAGEPPLLPRSQLIAISIYWFGINAMWGGYEIFGQHRVAAADPSQTAYRASQPAAVGGVTASAVRSAHLSSARRT